MKKHLAVIALFFIGNYAFGQKKAGTYFPPAGSWQTQTAAQLGLNQQAINQTISFAQAHEAKSSHNGGLSQFQSFGKEPFSDAVGPLTDRGGSSGVIIYKGYLAAQWGNPNRVDIVNSVTKSLLSTLVGIAVDRGLISSTMDTVANYVPFVEPYNFDINTTSHQAAQNILIYPFASAHNRRLTWEVMLRQTSDWEGTLWGKPDWADRPQGDIEQYKTRLRNEPGAVYKYNDVRVNALALAATSVWRKALPQVLKENVMDPIGASTTWRWTGYRTSWIIMDGQPVQSVSGGGHWGGGMFINSYDMARFGLLTLRKGSWNGRQIISQQWIKRALTPTTANTGYGYMNWFLNTDKKLLPSAPASAWVHIGNGTNMIYCDPEHDVVMVVRWIENKEMDGVVKNLLQAFAPQPPKGGIK
jgi:CubicO group peptidase (beta-lactamase class C family)